MGFITGNMSNFKQAVISFWFRVGAKTIDDITQEYKVWHKTVDAANAIGDTPPPRPRRFIGIVPLMTFGPDKLEAQQIYTIQRKVGDSPGSQGWHWFDSLGCASPRWVETIGSKDPGGPAMRSFYSLDGGNPLPGTSFVLDGSYIGVDCTGDTPALSVNIVMFNKPEWQGVIPTVSSTQYSGVLNTYIGSGVCPGAPEQYIGDQPGIMGNICYVNIIDSYWSSETCDSNAAAFLGNVPETFRLLPAARGGAAGTDKAAQDYTGIEVTSEHWHHLLLSMDFRDPVSVQGALHDGVSHNNAKRKTNSACQMFVLFDGHNRTHRSLTCYSPSDGGPNSILSVNGYTTFETVNVCTKSDGGVVAACNGLTSNFTSIQPLPTYDFKPEPVDGSNLGLPASGSYVDTIRHVEMAELQIFTGVSIDTGVKEARQAFISGSGKPTPPDKKWTPTSPVSGSIEYIAGLDREEFGIMDRPPTINDVLLHGSTKWQEGINAGASGDFGTVGEIDKYKPDPNLQGDQGKPELD